MARQIVEHRLIVLFAGCAFLICVSGCGDSPHLAPVQGAVTLDGKPIGPGNILFIPAGRESPRGKAASGSFEADGQFNLTTYDKGDGALVGEHTVVITPRAPGAEPGGEYPTNSKLPPIPKKYSNVAQTPLKATVNDGLNTIDFPLSKSP